MKVIIATIFPNENFFRMPYTWKKMPFFLLVTSRHCISMGNNDSINSRAIFYLYFTSYHFLRNSWILGGTRKQGAWIRDFRFEKPLVIISRISSQRPSHLRAPHVFTDKTCLGRHLIPPSTRSIPFRILKGPTMVYCNTLVYDYTYTISLRDHSKRPYIISLLNPITAKIIYKEDYRKSKKNYYSICLKTVRLIFYRFLEIFLNICKSIINYTISNNFGFNIII